MRCRSAVIDGEVIVQDNAGRSEFAGVQDAIRWHPERLVFFAFDLPFFNDEDLRDAPLEERREYLWIIITQSFDLRQKRAERPHFLKRNGSNSHAESYGVGTPRASSNDRSCTAVPAPASGGCAMDRLAHLIDARRPNRALGLVEFQHPLVPWRPRIGHAPPA